MAYTDMTSTFAFNRKLMWTDFDALADNAKSAYDALNEISFLANHNGNQTFNTSGNVAFNTEQWDVGGFYNNGTGRFTPTVLGRYLIGTTITYDASTLTNLGRYRTHFLKNGGTYNGGVWGKYNGINGSNYLGTTVFAIINQAVATDYWSVGVVASDPIDNSFTVLGGLNYSFFYAYRVTNY